VGTGAFVQRAIRDRLPDAPRVLASVVWSDATGVDYMLEGTVNGAGSALDWFAAREGTQMDALLRELEAGEPPDPPLFLNGVSGLGSPFWVDDFESRFVGEGTPAARLLAVVESIAFLIRVNLDELRSHGPALRRIVLTGGLSASDSFCRVVADVTGLAVWRSREPEATARGLASLVAGNTRTWKPADGDTFPPRSGSASARRYPAWLDAMKASLVGGAQAPTTVGTRVPPTE
jgi:glycerol kinase